MAGLSRRALVGTGAGLALAGPAAAAPKLTSSPDTYLLALCAEFFRVDTSVEMVPDDDALSSVMKARNELAERISATRAASAAGLQAKARVGHFLMNERHPPGVSFDDVDGYNLALLDELMAGSVEPISLSVLPDADLIELCAQADALQRQVDRLWSGPTRILDDDERDAVQAPLIAKQRPTLALISELEALTLQGHATRARTLLAFDKDPLDCDSPYMNEALMAAIVRDLALIRPTSAAS